jgi:hypothetical protein
MMSWLLGNKRVDRTDEIEEIKSKAPHNVEVVTGKRLALEKVIEQMKKDRANVAVGK